MTDIGCSIDNFSFVNAIHMLSFHEFDFAGMDLKTSG